MTIPLLLCKEPPGKASGKLRENADASGGELRARQHRHLCPAASHPPSSTRSRARLQLREFGFSNKPLRPNQAAPFCRGSQPAPGTPPHPRLPGAATPRAPRPKRRPPRQQPSPESRPPAAAQSSPASQRTQPGSRSLPLRPGPASPAAAAGPEPRTGRGWPLGTAPSWGDSGRDNAAAGTAGSARYVAVETTKPHLARPRPRGGDSQPGAPAPARRRVGTCEEAGSGPRRRGTEPPRRKEATMAAGGARASRTARRPGPQRSAGQAAARPTAGSGPAPDSYLRHGRVLSLFERPRSGGGGGSRFWRWLR